MAARCVKARNQRTVDKGAESGQHIARRDVVSSGNRLGCLDVEAADEDTEPRREGLMLLVEKFERRVQGRAERLLVRGCRARSAGQQFEAAVQAVEDFL